MISRRHKILFLHIPKTGGTTVEKMIFPHHSFITEPDYSTLYGWDNRLGWLNHLTMDQTIELYPCLDLNKYLLFTVVRNPWDRLVSEYHWKISISDLHIPFLEYVRLLYVGETEAIQKHYRSPIAFEQHIRPQACYFSQSIKGAVRVLKFENFEHEVVQILRECGVKIKSIPRIRASSHAHYTHYYNNRTIDMVGNLYLDDVEKFGYRYG